MVPSILRSLLSLLQPPYGWLLLIVVALPFWVLLAGVFMGRWSEEDGLRLRRVTERTFGAKTERDLARYASLLTALWLLIVAYKVYQQYFVAVPLKYSELGVFDLSLGLFCMASWAGILMLRAQERLQEDSHRRAHDSAEPG